jgi:hypothetical protein
VCFQGVVDAFITDEVLTDTHAVLKQGGVSKNRLDVTKYRLNVTKYRLNDAKYRSNDTKPRLNVTQYSLNVTQYSLNVTQYSLKVTQYSLNVTQYSLNVTQYSHKVAPCPHVVIMTHKHLESLSPLGVPNPNPNLNPNPKSLTLTPRRHGSQHVAQTGCGGILRHEKGTHTLSLPCVHGDGVGVNSALQCLTPSCGVFAAVEGLSLLSCHVCACVCLPACLPACLGSAWQCSGN